jgi:serine phosphatase RsbU (regulator of sigma subunit)
VNNYKSIFLFCVVLFFIALDIHAQTAFVVNQNTPIEFSDKNVLVYKDETNQATVHEVLEKLDEFVPAQKINGFQSSVTYWMYQKMVNKLETDREFRVDATGWKELVSHVIDSQGGIRILKPTGFVPPHNPYLSDSPQATPLTKFSSEFPIFTIKKDEEVTILSRAKFQPIFPGKSFSIHFVDNSSYSEFRRFSLYMEGLLLGILLALTVFAMFNAIQTKDRTNSFYALWISIAFLSVACVGVIDGNRLFEFFIDIEDLRAFNTDSYGYTISLAFLFAQAISYVLFARQYLGVKKYFPKIYILSNLWIAYALFYAFLALTGSFYTADTWFPAPPIAVAYSSSVAVILLCLFVCSYLRYRAGFGFAIFFTYAVIPYLVFRLSFLFGVIGMPSPFSYLPDHAFGYFLKNPWTNQAFGICLEALIMALAVVSRARWLQNELTVRARQQTELIEAQNAMLEAKVQERTQELSAKHELVVSSVNYASRLQRGQLPRQIRTEGRFKSFASIWEPRDTIGGDLYWLSSSQQSGPFVLAVADCTGHGVPGAMLSLLVSNSLERIYAIDTAEDPAAALMSLDHYVRTGLNQDRAGSESDDGCDAAVLRIDRDKNTIEFAGAKLGLFQVNAQGVLTRHQAARCSLGYQDVVVEADKPVVKKISYQSGDVFAVVTDGFTDQIGGSTGKTSFGYRRLEDILKANYKASAEEITVAMRNEFAAWQGTNARRDDVTAVVFRL